MKDPTKHNTGIVTICNVQTAMKTPECSLNFNEELPLKRNTFCARSDADLC